MFLGGCQVLVCTMGNGLSNMMCLISRYVGPEYLVTPPGTGEKPIVIKEPRNWFWQRKKEDKQE
jgi:hypothetical protein